MSLALFLSTDVFCYSVMCWLILAMTWNVLVDFGYDLSQVSGQYQTSFKCTHIGYGKICYDKHGNTNSMLLYILLHIFMILL